MREIWDTVTKQYLFQQILSDPHCPIPPHAVHSYDVPQLATPARAQLRSYDLLYLAWQRFASVFAEIASPIPEQLFACAVFPTVNRLSLRHFALYYLRLVIPVVGVHSYAYDRESRS